MFLVLEGVRGLKSMGLPLNAPITYISKYSYSWFDTVLQLTFLFGREQLLYFYHMEKFEVYGLITTEHLKVFKN